MKNFTKFLAIAFFGFAFTVNSFGQSTITANASATILTPITVTLNSSMDFGNVAGSATSGTVVLATNSSRTFTGGVTLLAGGTPSAASFQVSGVAAQNFTFSLPATITLTSGVNTMTVNTFVNNAPAAITGGSVAVLVGATLNVNANQAAGAYTNTTDLTATVNYN